MREWRGAGLLPSLGSTTLPVPPVSSRFSRLSMEASWGSMMTRSLALAGTSAQQLPTLPALGNRRKVPTSEPHGRSPGTKPHPETARDSPPPPAIP